MLRKLKDFFGIVEGRKTAVACGDCCGWDSGSEVYDGKIVIGGGCTVKFPTCKWTFNPEKGWIEKIHEVSPWKENRFGRCPYFEAKEQEPTAIGVISSAFSALSKAVQNAAKHAGPAGGFTAGGVVCTPHKGGGFDLEIRKAKLEEALDGTIHSATENEEKKPYPYFREKEAKNEG